MILKNSRLHQSTEGTCRSRAKTLPFRTTYYADGPGCMSLDAPAFNRTNRGSPTWPYCAVAGPPCNMCGHLQELAVYPPPLVRSAPTDVAIWSTRGNNQSKSRQVTSASAIRYPLPTPSAAFRHSVLVQRLQRPGPCCLCGSPLSRSLSPGHTRPGRASVVVVRLRGTIPSLAPSPRSLQPKDGRRTHADAQALAQFVSSNEHVPSRAGKIGSSIQGARKHAAESRFVPFPAFECFFFFLPPPQIPSPAPPPTRGKATVVMGGF